jgi:hydroxyacylglutathione hydrolase
MFFQQIVREDLGCAAYIVGSTDAGECVVVDPRLDEVDELIDLVAHKQMRIVAIIETHNHADHIAGHNELAARTGALIYVHEAADVLYPHQDLHDGDEITIGEVKIHVLHTPGHRPEHIALAIADTSRSDEPWLVLTGDSLFIGDVARPDLAIDGTEGAKQLYSSLFEKLLALPDSVEVYPGHVAGSLCGRVMNLKTSSTIGYERRHNSALHVGSQLEFVRALNANLPQRPPNMENIVSLNRGLMTLELTQPPLLSPQAFNAARQDAIVLDVRSPAVVGASHVPGSLNVDLYGPQFGTRVGFIIPADADLLLILPSWEDVHTALVELAVVGYTRVRGILAGGIRAWEVAGLPVETIPQISVHDLHKELGHPNFAVLDVREDSEWEAGHIATATHIPYHQLVHHLEEVPRASILAVICGTGQRSSIAASLLQAHGFAGLQNVEGGMGAWYAAGYETVCSEMKTPSIASSM